MTPTESLLPISLHIEGKMVSVDWMEFNPHELRDPFFQQTIRRLRRRQPTPSVCRTGLSDLIDLNSKGRFIEPAGIILHISRCGSTLVSNSLRYAKNALVMSEAPIIGMALRLGRLQTTSPNDARKLQAASAALLRSAIGLYANSSFGVDTRIIIKANAFNIVQIRKIRRIWPTVPILILIRDPTEVVVSNLRRRSGWLVAQRRHLQRSGSELDGRHVFPSVEEDCARGIGLFCAAAARDVDALCRVVDYSRLAVQTVYDIAHFFSLEIPTVNNSSLDNLWTVWAKDPLQRKAFFNDSAFKQDSASELVRTAVNVWAREPYLTLKRQTVTVN